MTQQADPERPEYVRSSQCAGVDIPSRPSTINRPDLAAVLGDQHEVLVGEGVDRRYELRSDAELGQIRRQNVSATGLPEVGPYQDRLITSSARSAGDSSVYGGGLMRQVSVLARQVVSASKGA